MTSLVTYYYYALRNGQAQSIIGSVVRKTFYGECKNYFMTTASERWLNEWKIPGLLANFYGGRRVSSEVLIQKPIANDGHWGCVNFFQHRFEHFPFYSSLLCCSGINNLHEFIPSSKNILSNQFWLSSWKRWVCVSGLIFAWFISLSKCFWYCWMLRLNSNEAALIMRSSHTHSFNKTKKFSCAFPLILFFLHSAWWRLHLLTINYYFFLGNVLQRTICKFHYWSNFSRSEVIFDG